MSVPKPPTETATVLLVRRPVAVLDKPSGLLVHSSAWAGPREHTLVDDARALLDAPLGADFHPVHRLDRGTSGVVVFAEAGAVPDVQAALGRDDADKRYWALVRGHVKGRVEIDHAIVDEETGVAREARSVVEPLLVSSVDRCSLVEVRLLTGRRHQARRHLKHISHPVIGDATHGKGPINRAYRDLYGLDRLGLHARSVAFSLTTSGERIHATSPLPASFRDPLARLFGDALGDVEKHT
jgi:tRNA pseudouridine65 synthase